MKKFFIVLGSVAAVLALILTVVFYATSGAVRTADAFFASVAHGDMETARGFLSTEFQSSTSDEELLAFIEESGLDEYVSSDWGGRAVDTSSGTLSGKVITRSGAAIPLTMTFVRENGQWKIYYIERESSGINLATKEQLALPDRKEASEIVQATTSAFAEAVNAKDLSGFHASASTQFQEQVPLEQLNEHFAAFLNQEIDLSILADFEPMFTADPALSADGVLRLEGYFPTTPSRAHFSYSFVHDGDGWKLLGIDFNVRPIETGG